MKYQYRVVYNQQSKTYNLCLLELSENDELKNSHQLPGFSADSVEELCVIYTHLGSALTSTPVAVETEQHQTASTGVQSALDLLRNSS